MTFQSPMNELLCLFLRHPMLVFFDDILNYNMSLSKHLGHIRVVFSTLCEHNLFLKHTKCSFAKRWVEYLGHFISKDGVAMYPAKIVAMQS